MLSLWRALINEKQNIFESNNCDRKCAAQLVITLTESELESAAGGLVFVDKDRGTATTTPRYPGFE
jgi:hypothetical protein